MVGARLAEIEKGNGPAAANRVRASLSAYFTWLAREGYAEANPVAFTNKAVLSPSRGLGIVPSRFALDRAMDMMAHRLGKEPAEIRRLNLIDKHLSRSSSARSAAADELEVASVRTCTRAK